MEDPKEKNGQSLVEILIALGLFVAAISAVAILTFSGLLTGGRASQDDRAGFLASEGVEAVRSLRDRDWELLLQAENGYTHGVSNATGAWAWVQPMAPNTSDTFDGGKYVRTIEVTGVNRDAGGNIAATGSNDPDTKMVTVRVRWGPPLSREVSRTFYLTHWN